MPIILVAGQLASGSFNAASGSATLPVGTTAGNTVILTVDTNSASGITLPTGFVKDTPTVVGAQKLSIYRRSNVPAGETSWTISVGVTAPVAWEVREYEGIDPDFPVDVVPSAYQFSGSASSIAAGPTPASTAYDGLFICAHGGNSTTTTPPTWSGHTGGVTEDTDQGAVGATTAVGLSVSSVTVASLAAWQVTATCSITAALGATCVLYAATGSKHASALVDILGFEWLTTAGLATGTTTQRLVEAFTGSPEVVNDPTKARTGNGYLRLSATAAAENVSGAGATLSAVGNPRGVLQRRCLRFDGGLPSVDTELFSIDPATGGGNTVCRYVAASQKLGCKIGTGTEVLSDAAVTADHWIAVDIRLTTTTTSHTADWQVTYDATPGASTVPVEQTQATFTASVVPSAYTYRIGWTGAITPGVPVLFDDCADSLRIANYPIGDHRIYLLKPAGPLTISGTSSNFALMAANATGGAWDAAAALTNISDVPPVIGASASGFCQTAIAATDYVEIPMETLQAAPDGSIRAVKRLICGWAASTTAATIALIFVTSADTPPGSPTATDPNFDNDVANPAWVCGMLNPTGGWTQAVLDSLSFRVGYSTDATPDIGVHAVLAEVAKQMATSADVFGVAGDVRVTSQGDVLSGGVLGLDTTTPEGKGTSLTYQESGSPTTITVPAASSQSEMVDAADATVVNRMDLYPDPEGVADT